MGKQGQSIQSTFSPKQIEIIKTGIALKYSDSQCASEIINFNKKDTTPSSDHSSTLKPDYKKLKDVSQNDTGNDYLYRVKDHID